MSDEGAQTNALVGAQSDELRPDSVKGVLQVDIVPIDADPIRWQEFTAALLRSVIRALVRLGQSAFLSADAFARSLAVRSAEKEASVNLKLAEAREKAANAAKTDAVARGLDARTQVALARSEAQSHEEILGTIDALRERGFDAWPLVEKGRIVGLFISDPPGQTPGARQVLSEPDET